MAELIFKIGIILVPILVAFFIWLFFRHKNYRWANDLFENLMKFINWIIRETTHMGRS
jgi:hypothetical protein